MAETQQNQPRPKLLSAQHTLLTAEDLWKQADDGYRYELVKGVMCRMPPAGFEHGIRAAKIGRHLDEHVERHKLGYVCGAETGFKISQNPDTVRAPDAAFVRQAAIDEQGIPKGYWKGAPDLAVEIISPSDTYAEVAEKVDEWLNAGCAMVWVVNPRRETIEVYRALKESSQEASGEIRRRGFVPNEPKRITIQKTVLRGDDILDGGDVIERFQCHVRELFV